MTIDLGGSKTVTCSRCGFDVRYDDNSAIVSDVMAVHWFDHHGLVEWRDTAAEARHRLCTTGYSDILDQLVDAGTSLQRMAH